MLNEVNPPLHKAPVLTGENTGADFTRSLHTAGQDNTLASQNIGLRSWTRSLYNSSESDKRMYGKRINAIAAQRADSEALIAHIIRKQPYFTHFRYMDDWNDITVALQTENNRMLARIDEAQVLNKKVRDGEEPISELTLIVKDLEDNFQTPARTIFVERMQQAFATLGFPHKFNHKIDFAKKDIYKIANPRN